MANNLNQPVTNTPVSLPWWNWLTNPHPLITVAADRKKAELSAILAIALVLFNIAGGIATRQRSSDNIIQIFGVPVIISLFAYAIIRTRFFPLGSFLLIVGFCTSGYLNIISDRLEVRIGILFYIPIALTIGSALISSWTLFLLTGLNVAVIFLLPFAGVVLPNNIGGVIGLITSFGLALIFINNFRRNIEIKQLYELQKITQESIEIHANMQQRVEERTLILDRRTARLEAATFVARTAAEIRDLKKLLESVSKQISERFGFYHVGIFLADENNFQLNLVAASSEGGERMLTRGHRLKIGREGIVGFTAYQKRPHIAQNVGSDTVFFKNPDLPTTQSEAALPLLAQNHLIGVLDIQSEEENAFTPEDISIMQTMTDQIALAIENIRLVEQSHTALLNLQSMNKENISKTWRDRLGSQGLGFTYTPLGIKPISDENLGDKIDAESNKTFKVPISLRGKNIGSITLIRKSKDSIWAETEKEVVQQIATQVALAIENARLLEKSQNRAVREQTMNEFSSHFNRSLDIDTLLQNAVQEIYRLPQVSQVSLFISPVEETQKPK